MVKRYDPWSSLRSARGVEEPSDRCKRCKYFFGQFAGGQYIHCSVHLKSEPDPKGECDDFALGEYSKILEDHRPQLTGNWDSVVFESLTPCLMCGDMSHSRMANEVGQTLCPVCFVTYATTSK